MGVIICREHGRSGIAFVCPHVAEAVGAGAPLPMRSTVLVEIEGGVVLEPTFCARCIAEGSIPTRPQRMSGEDFERMTQTKLDPVPVCGKCFAAAKAAET